MNDTKKLSKYKWMDPSKDWGQNEGSQGLEGKETREETGNLCLQEGELPKLLRIVSSQEDSVPGSGKPTAMK